jgi:hypothetical protein
VRYFLATQGHRNTVGVAIAGAENCIIRRIKRLLL